LIGLSPPILDQTQLTPPHPPTRRVRDILITGEKDVRKYHPWDLSAKFFFVKVLILAAVIGKPRVPLDHGRQVFLKH